MKALRVLILPRHSPAVADSTTGAASDTPDDDAPFYEFELSLDTLETATKRGDPAGLQKTNE